MVGSRRLSMINVVVLVAGLLAVSMPRAAKAANQAEAVRVASPITIDGAAESAWYGRLTSAVTNVVLGSVASSSDLSGNYGLLWDNTNLYLLVEVQDDSLRNDSAAVFDDDAIDLYLDLNHDAGTSYGPDDFMFQLGYGDTVVQEAKHNATTGAAVASVPTPGGYRLEAKIPWSTLGKTPTTGMIVGLDVFINDDDTGGVRDAQMSWNSPDANAYLYPDRFGDALLLAGATEPVSGYTPAAGITTQVMIDGVAEVEWAGRVANPISRVILGTVTSSADLSGTYSVLWNRSYLYLLVDVNDDLLRNDSAAVFDDDSIDLYLDLNHDAGTSYGADDFMFQFSYGDSTFREVKHNATAGVQVASAARTGGYRVELQIPWSTVGVTAATNTLIGLDVMVNDDDDGGTRDAQISWNSPDANAYLYPDRFGDSRLTWPGGPTNPTASRGATVPWKTYEAESATTNGTIVATNQLGKEASGGKGVTLDATGEYIEFTSQAEANQLVLRYSIPATTTGTLSLYLNGVHYKDIPVRSDKLYELKNDGTKTIRFYDEVDVATTIHAGDVVRLRKDAGDTVASYTIDLVDLELAPAPGTMPSGFISVTAYGATPDDTTDDWAAIDTALKAAQAQGQGLWFPPGTFRQSQRLSVPADVQVKGAGLWYTKLFGYIRPSDTEGSALAGFSILGNNVSISDLRLTASIDTRLKTRPAISDLNGATNYRIENVWVEYFNSGFWLRGGYLGIVRNNRVRLTYADAIHATENERDTLIENNHVRGCGDDGIATVSAVLSSTSAPAQNIVARFNTIAANYWGRGMSVVGGTNIRYEDNVIHDQAYAAGMLIATETSYNTLGIDGVIYQRNSILRSGGESYFGTGHGGITISIQRPGVQALNVNVLNNEIRDAKKYGILVNGSQYQQTTIRYNTIIYPSATAIVNSATVGDIIISDNVVQ